MTRKASALTFVTLFIQALITLMAMAATATAQNPVPFLDQPLIPDATAPGGTGFTLTVSGAWFIPASVVNWNGSPRATTYVSKSQLTAAILASDIAKASTASITVVNPSPGGGVSNIQYFLITVPETSVSFLPAIAYNSDGYETVSIAVADVNGDGKPDLVVTSWCTNYAGCLSASPTPGAVGVLLGNGDGTFRPVVSYNSGGGRPGSVAIADVNGDGKPDLVVANSCAYDANGTCYGTGSVGVLLANGDGTFQPAENYPAGTSPASAAVADVNGDGKLDVIVATCCETNGDGSVGVLLGNGDGTFQSAVLYDSGGEAASSIAIADVSGDGKLDLLVANRSMGNGGDGSVGVLLGNGNGTFQSAVLYDSGGEGASSIAIADVNADGKPDLVVANSCATTASCGANGSVGVLLGNGDGTFKPPVSYDSGGAIAGSVAIGDANGDGKPDLAVANLCGPPGCPNDDASVGVLLGNGDGTFHAAVAYYPGGEGAASVAVADVNGDGRLDALVALNCIGSNCVAGSVGVLLNNTGPCTAKCATSTVLASNLNPSIYGQSVTFTATVTTTGSIPPTGTVVFSWSGNVIGSAALNSSGVATLIKANLNADTFPLTAVYKGDANNLGSTSAVMNQVVKQTMSSATLTSSPNPSNLGQSVTFTAKILSPTVKARGPVTFTAGTTVLGAAQLGWNNEAILSISSLTTGSTRVTATYDGDSNIKGSSASVTQVVQ